MSDKKQEKQEKPKIPEVVSEQTLLFKFGNMISGIVNALRGLGPNAQKKPEAKSEKPKEGK